VYEIRLINLMFNAIPGPNFIIIDLPSVLILVNADPLLFCFDDN